MPPPPLVVVCEGCRRTLRAAADLAGRTFRCPVCGRMNALPEDAGRASDDGLDLLPRTQCPHCWHSFAPEDALAVAATESLSGDLALGPEAAIRFPPSRFTAGGLPRDGQGTVCLQMACPRCHLAFPRDLLSALPTFVSMVGAPGTGKSYLLASMVNRLRRTLPDRFFVSFEDADTVSNAILEEYERVLFHALDGHGLAALRKTEVRGGGLYSEVALGGQPVSLPRPFLFSARPMERHARAGEGARARTMLVLYDNAGESFNPGADAAQSPVTRHIAYSDAIFFLFDPTKDAAFRRRLTGDDPQLRNDDVRRQTLILAELALRIRALANLPAGRRHGKPLYVVVAKYDVWRGLLRDPPSEPPLFLAPDGGWRLDRGAVDSASLAVRGLLRGLCPDLVAAAEGSWSRVRYLPASATGCSPVLDPGTGALGFHPADLRPVWADVPLALFLAEHAEEGGPLVPSGEPAPAEPPLRPPVRRAGNLWLVDLPGRAEPLEAPLDFAGRALACPETGRRFVIDGDAG